MKRQFYLPLNLQLFAEDGPEDEIEFELEDDDEGIELSSEDDNDDEGEEMSDGDGHQGAEGSEDSEESDSDDSDASAADQRHKQVKGKGNNPTAAAVIAERKKWQAKLKEAEKAAAIAKRFMQQTGATDLEELNRRMDAFESQRLQEQGVPQELADRIAATERQLKEQQTDIRRQKFAVEAERLKSDPFYSDLDDHLEELESLAERTGQSLKSVYLAEHGERRLKEREAEIEAKVKANKENRAKKKVDTSPTGSSSNKQMKRVTLSATERAIAKAAGMTPEEYAKYKR